jgi:hypothetical protein
LPGGGNSGDGGDEGTGRPSLGSSSGLDGLNKALNAEGLPGLTLGGGQVSEGDGGNADVAIQSGNKTVVISGDLPDGTVVNIPADGKKGSPFEKGGQAVVSDEGGGTIDIYGYTRNLGGGLKTRSIVSIVPRFDPNPADDGTTSGPGRVPVDGNGNLPPIGGKVDGERKPEGKMQAVAAKGSLWTNLAHLSQRSGQGIGSSPSTVGMQGHINPNPDAGNNDNREEIGNIKTIRFQSDGVLDPIPSPMLAGRLRLRG